MILIATAMRVEAKPLIKRLKLRYVSNTNPAIYANDEFALVLTGVGGIRAAAAIGYCFGKLDSVAVVVNVGVAGCVNAEVGEVFVANKLRDCTTNRVRFPDMMMRFELPEATLATHATVQSKGSADELVDMEGFAIFDAATVFLPPHRIVILKIVSDLIDGSLPGASDIENIVEGATSAITTALTVTSNLPEDATDPLKDHVDVVNALANNLRLTVAQRARLKNVMRDRLTNRSTTLPDLNEFVNEPVATKREGKMRFEKLEEKLLDD